MSFLQIFNWNNWDSLFVNNRNWVNDLAELADRHFSIRRYVMLWCHFEELWKERKRGPERWYTRLFEDLIYMEISLVRIHTEIRRVTITQIVIWDREWRCNIPCANNGNHMRIISFLLHEMEVPHGQTGKHLLLRCEELYYCIVLYESKIG